MSEENIKLDLDQVLAKIRLISAYPDTVIEFNFVMGLGNSILRFQTLAEDHPIKKDPRYKFVVEAYCDLLEYARAQNSSDNATASANWNAGSSVSLSTSDGLANFLTGMIKLAEDINAGKNVVGIDAKYVIHCREAVVRLPSFKSDYRINANYDLIAQRLDSAQKTIAGEYARQMLNQPLERKIS